MPTLESVVGSLKAKASEKTRATYLRHGNPAERTLGVSVADIKAIAKTIRGEQALALELYATGLLEAMYLAGIVAHGAKMTEAELQAWAEGAASMTMISDYTVSWVAVEHPAGRKLALDWMKSGQEHVASAGWRTYQGLLMTRADSELDLKEIEGLLESIPVKIKGAPNRVRAMMNSFVIAVGIYVAPLAAKAKAVAAELGVVPVDMGDTACEIPLATAYIAKAEAAGKLGLKRKTIRC